MFAPAKQGVREPVASARLLSPDPRAALGFGGEFVH